MTSKLRRNLKIVLWLFIAMFLVLIGYLGYAVTTYGEKWFATPYNQRLTNAAGIVRAGSILDRNSAELAWTEDGERNYSESKTMRRAVCHVVGDNRGKSLGAETVFAKYLLGFEKSIADRMEDAVSGNDKRGSDITLTIDSKLCRLGYEALDDRRGSVAAINYKTGEIIALTNDPTFDPYRLDEDQITETSLVNRATMGRYAPGSTMKIVTAAAAINAGETGFKTTCDGAVVIGGQRITCADEHGSVDFEEAFRESCNCYFAELSVEIGGQGLLTAANSFAFNTEFNFGDISLYSSSFEVSAESGDVAWAGVGLYNDLITPLHSAMIAGAIANDGVMMEPKLLLKVGDDAVIQPEAFKTVISASAAKRIGELMEDVVESGTGTRAAVEGYTICGKTGTADYVSDGERKSRAWFTGYIDDDRYPYAVAVLLEDAGSGGSSAAPIAREVFEYLLGE